MFNDETSSHQPVLSTELRNWRATRCWPKMQGRPLDVEAFPTAPLISLQKRKERKEKKKKKSCRPWWTTTDSKTLYKSRKKEMEREGEKRFNLSAYFSVYFPVCVSIFCVSLARNDVVKYHHCLLAKPLSFSSSSAVTLISIDVDSAKYLCSRRPRRGITIIAGESSQLPITRTAGAVLALTSL